MNKLMLFILAMALGASAGAQDMMGSKGSAIQVLGAEQTASLNLPFSEAVAVGDLLFLSGQLGTLPGKTTVVPGGIQAETRQAMKNIINILEKYGSRRENIAKCTIFLADIDEWGAMNVAYLEALGSHRPARSALAAKGLALGGRVEIECIAGGAKHLH